MLFTSLTNSDSTSFHVLSSNTSKWIWIC